MIANRAADYRDVAILNVVNGRLYTGQPDADTCGREIDSPTLPAPQHFGVASFDLHLGLACRLCKARDDAIESLNLEPFFNECIERQVQGPGTGYRKVVCRSVNRQAAYVATREFKRLNREPVRRNQYVFTIECDWCGVGQHVQLRLIEVACKHLLDKFAHETTTITMSKRDAIIIHRSDSPWRPVQRPGRNLGRHR